MLENEGVDQIYGTDPFETSIANQYAWGGDALSNGGTGYYAVCHPSAPNYLALTSGGSLQCGSDGYTNYTDGSNLFGLLDSAGLPWVAYAESMPTACDTSNSGEYVIRHNPVPYYGDLGGNANGSICETHDLPIANLTQDYPYNSTPPAFTYIGPNLLNDGHDTSAAVADSFLSQFIPRLENTSWFSSSAIFITYDESYGASPNGGYDGLDGGPVYMVSVSNYSRGIGAVDSVNDSHYNLLSTIEWLLGLPGTGTGHDGTAQFPAMKGLFDFGTPLKSTLSANTTSGPSPLQVLFEGNATGGLPPYQYLWEFGDGSFGSGASDVHEYTIPGSFRAQLEVLDAAGDTNLTNLTIHVGVEELRVTLSATNLTGIAPFAVTFTASPSRGIGPYSASWEFGDGAIGVGLVATHTYDIGGTFTVTARVWDSAIGFNISHLTAQVYAPLAVGIFLYQLNATVGSRVMADSSVTGGWPGVDRYQWTIDGSPAPNGTGHALNFTASGEGLDKLALTVTDPAGDRSSAFGEVNIRAAPGASSSTAGGRLLSGPIFTITITTIGGVAGSAIVALLLKRRKAPPPP